MVTQYKSVGTDIQNLPSLGPNTFESKPAELLLPKPRGDTSDFQHIQSDVLTRDKSAELCLQRAKQYLSNNDPMQASEKLYKATEESIKYLAEHYQARAFVRAKTEGQWWTKLLGQAAKELSKKTNLKEIDEAFVRALDLHMNGFHENAYTVEDIRPVVPIVEKLIEYVWEVSNGGRKTNP